VSDGRVLDTSALLDAAAGRTEYLRALIYTLVRRRGSLLIPSSAWLEAWALGDDGARVLLELFSTAKYVVFDVLDVDSGRQAGLLAAGAHQKGLGWDVRQAHVVAAALRTGWPVVTTDPDPLLYIEAAVPIEQLP
jgi:predicted nucleic acid-binding protein